MRNKGSGVRGRGSDTEIRKVVALAGGVGGAKMAAGLQAVLPPGDLSVVVNTADDFTLWGLYISPDVDTVLYTLAGIANRETGWGLAGETWNALEMLGRYGVDTWFRIGDKDMATHVLRTQLRAEGHTLSEITGRMAKGLGVATHILPMSDEPVATLVETPDGTLDFQDYFVRHRHSGAVTGVTFRGIERARPTDAVRETISEADAIIFCPSNPIVSIGPLLAVPGMRELIEQSAAVKVAVSPIVGGAAIKGPAAEMLSGLGFEVSPVGVASIYGRLIDGIVIDRVDQTLAPRVESLGMDTLVTSTVMGGDESRAALAGEVLAFCGRLRSGRASIAT
jgi:LPPG:FO 2-phospho-L-lactate transferase